MTLVKHYLVQRHLNQLLEGSGISLDVIKERGYRTITKKKELVVLGFSRAQQIIPGLLMPVSTTDGSAAALHAYRPDVPREKNGKCQKYEFPYGAPMRIDVPPRCREDIGNPFIPVWFTEGQKKADALASRGLCAVALLGVWNFKGKNDLGGTTVLADLDHIALKAGRSVNIVFDNDVMTKFSVRKALDRFSQILTNRGANVSYAYLPVGEDKAKIGVDDYLLTHSVADLKALTDKPKPTPNPTTPNIKWLDKAKPILKTPLEKIDGHCYAVTWIHMETTTEESVDKDGDLVRHNPPLVTTSREMVVVRDDGQLFGRGCDNSIEDLDSPVILTTPPLDEFLWQKPGVEAFGEGYRPDPEDVFSRIEGVYDRFLDFSRSLADQVLMCKLSACYSLMTYFTAVFNVLPYPWPNGGTGSGKTKWGTCWAETSYLGMVILPSTTFAVLRDLAEYRATMLFDDAENMADPKKSDPNKRQLFLAGNRRGAKVALKELQPDGTWAIKYTNAFCPRGFTAIDLPDPVLGSRSTRIPLVRTSDTRKGNADPGNTKTWPCDQRRLRDDLWALSLMLMDEAEDIWDSLDDEDSIVGRDFEPWRAVIAIAKLFERHGVENLEVDMRKVMRAYQLEKLELGDGDRTIQVVKGLMILAGIADTLDTSDSSDSSDTSDTCNGAIEASLVKFTAGDLSETIKIAEGLISGKDEWKEHWASPVRVGIILGQQLRLKQVRLPDTKRTRQWRTTNLEIQGIAQSYGVLPMASFDNDQSATTPLITSVQSGQSVRSVRDIYEHTGITTESRIPKEINEELRI